MNDRNREKCAVNAAVTEATSECDTTGFPENTSLAMAYVPFQLDLSYYDPQDALKKGTLFAALFKPFRGRCVC